MTIPAGAFEQAGLQVGDVLEVEAAAPGRLVLRTVESLVDRHAGCLDTSGALRRELEQLRDEWR